MGAVAPHAQVAPSEAENKRTITQKIMFDQIFDLSLFREIADWRVLCYILLALVILFIAKLINGKLSDYELNHELTENDNKAIAISFSGFLIALCIVISGVLFSPSSMDSMDEAASPFLQDIKMTLIWSAVGVSLLLISRLLCDKLMLPSFSNKVELVRDRNVGVGFVQAGAYVSTALVLKASLSSPVDLPLLEDIGLTAIWFIVSQILIILYSIAYQKTTKHDIHQELKNDNAAVGVALAGNIIAFGILLSFFIAVYDSILGLIIWAVLSMVMLGLVRFAVDKLILPGHSLSTELSEDRNWGAGAIEAVTAIGAALIITGAFH
jgi:uncharacterized membrane protein YjfL (UPF0719 family)